MVSTKGLTLMSEMRKLVINDMDCPDVAMVIGPLIALEQPLLFSESVQHIVIFILVINLNKNLDNLAVTRRSV